MRAPPEGSHLMLHAKPARLLRLETDVTARSLRLETGVTDWVLHQVLMAAPITNRCIGHVAGSADARLPCQSGMSLCLTGPQERTAVRKEVGECR